MKITFDSNYGNFAYRMSAEVEEKELSPLALALAIQGLANIAYRVAGSAVDKALGASSKNGGRRGVDFSEEDSEKINAAVNATIGRLEASENDPIPSGISFAVSGQHVFGEGASAMVRATGFVDTLIAKDETQLRLVLSLYDAAAKDANRDALIEIAHKAGLGLQAAKKAS